MCVYCRRYGVDVKGQEVDHIIELSDGGSPFELDNLQLLCKPCHSKKSAKEKRNRKIQ